MDYNGGGGVAEECCVRPSQLAPGAYVSRHSLSNGQENTDDAINMFVPADDRSPRLQRPAKVVERPSSATWAEEVDMDPASLEQPLLFLSPLSQAVPSPTGLSLADLAATSSIYSIGAHSVLPFPLPVSSKFVSTKSEKESPIAKSQAHCQYDHTEASDKYWQQEGGGAVKEKEEKENEGAAEQQVGGGNMEWERQDVAEGPDYDSKEDNASAITEVVVSGDSNDSNISLPERTKGSAREPETMTSPSVKFLAATQDVNANEQLCFQQVKIFELLLLWVS